MSDLDIATNEAAYHLEKIQGLFKRAKVTLICRTPGNDEADFVLTDDEPREAIRALERRISAEPGAEAASKALELVIAERKRQIEQIGYTSEHDDQYDPGELSGAGAAYILHAACEMHPIGDSFDAGDVPPGWCWPEDRFNPKTPARNLIMGVALAIAELERMERAGVLDATP